MSSRKRSTNDGDWVCGDAKCGNVNFSRRHQCNRCGAEKSHTTIKAGGTAIGKQLAEKSKGLFSADDWQCKTCGNVNWARRSDCNLCKTPKFGKQEARTGYGGGYNERLGVEYKSDNDDSDGEFDIYGRKKKKYRGSLPPKPEDEKKETRAQEEEEEEESGDDGDLDAYKLDSDEDDDDEDLSKYDLDADDDIPTSKPSAEDTKTTTMRNDKVSRSHSQTPSGSSGSSSSSSSSGSSKSSGSRSSSGSSSYRRSRSRSRSSDRKYRRQSDSRRSRTPEKRRRSRSRERSDNPKRLRHRSRSR
ncbi:zinc finger Ran-binding domain-containing protein 2-like isoform X2 [Asterias rubens]|uniref:zinc finger Ran-binding domain-containing protein 2-like isoform X2 n=1 Tax=Asterias rubens TaxID=7604 RepID=UPI0014556C51|nr:zinc finger Ran-binding domain-containing protein 2-like isoform X2 [Asterias rubens]